MRNLGLTKATLAMVVLAISAGASSQVTSGFGVRKDPFHGKSARHGGIDMASPTGTPIYATADAIVGRSGWYGAYGNMVELNHAGGYQTRYGHMHQVLVRAGQYIRRGMIVGLVGSTGRSTGPHLHYEVRYNGKAIDPSPYIRGWYRSAARPAQGAMGGPAG